MPDSQGRLSIVKEPSVLFIPRPGAQRLDGGDEPGADFVCASIDFGAGDDNPLLRGLPALLRVPLAQLPGLDLAQQVLFNEAQASRCGHGAVVGPSLASRRCQGVHGLGNAPEFIA